MMFLLTQHYGIHTNCNYNLGPTPRQIIEEFYDNEAYWKEMSTSPSCDQSDLYLSWLHWAPSEKFRLNDLFDKGEVLPDDDSDEDDDEDDPEDFSSDGDGDGDPMPGTPKPADDEDEDQDEGEGEDEDESGDDDGDEDEDEDEAEDEGEDEEENDYDDGMDGSSGPSLTSGSEYVPSRER